MPTSTRKTTSRKKSSGSKPAVSQWRSSTWIGLLVFVSVWMFIIGVLVGRGTVSTGFDFVDSKKELAASLKEVARSEHQSGLPSDLDNEMTSDPIKELKESQRKKTITTPNSGNKPSRSEIKKADPPASSVKKKTTAPEKAGKKKPQKSTSANPVKPTVPAKQKTNGKSKRRFLQAAAMKNLQDAKRMVIQLRKKGFNAYVATAIIPGKGESHRVRIGPYENEQKARMALLRLKQGGIQGILLP